MGVEKVGDEGEVEFWVAGDEGGGGEEFAAGELVGVVEDLFGAGEKVSGLEGGTAAGFRRELVEEHGVVVAFFYVGGEVCDSNRGFSTCSGSAARRLYLLSHFAFFKW